MIKQLVQRFDARGVELKTKNKNPKKGQPGGAGEVAKMAKAATARRQNESEIQEMAALLEVLALRQVILNEGRLDEAGAWNAVKSAASSAASGAAAGYDKASEVLKRVKELAKKSTPVQGFDTQVTGLLQKIGTANPKAASAAAKYKEWALKPENQWKQSVVIGILTAMASLAGGPWAGSGMAAVLRLSNDILKGAKPSEALGNAAISAGVGAVGGAVAHGITGPLFDLLKGFAIQNIPLPQMPDFVKQSITINGAKHVVTILKADQDKISEFHKVMQELGNAAKNADPDGNQKWNLLARIQTKMYELHGHLYQLVSPDYAEKMLKVAQDANFVRQATIDNDSTIKAIGGISKALDAAVQGAASSGAGSKIAGAASKAAGAVGKAAGAVGGALGKAGAAVKASGALDKAAGAVGGALGKAGSAVKGALANRQAAPVAPAAPAPAPQAQAPVAPKAAPTAAPQAAAPQAAPAAGQETDAQRRARIKAKQQAFQAQQKLKESIEYMKLSIEYNKIKS
jgi:hypothetical protein